MAQLNIVERLKLEFKQGGYFKQILLVNVLVFVFFTVLMMFSKLFKVPNIYNYLADLFAMPGQFSEIIWQPWTIITSLFMHKDVYHLLLNMLMFYFVGQLFLNYFSQRKLLLLYILGGIFGAFLHVASYQVFPYLTMRDPKGLIGASAAIYAFFGAILYYRPTVNVQLLFGINIPFWVLAIFFLIGDIMSLTRLDGVAHFAHLGGAIFGIIAMVNIDKSTQFMNKLEMWLKNFSLKNTFKRKPKLKVHKNKDYRKMNDDQYRESKTNQQDKVNAILDKISKGGYESLSKTEKEFLFKFSNEK